MIICFTTGLSDSDTAAFLQPAPLPLQDAGKSVKCRSNGDNTRYDKTSPTLPHEQAVIGVGPELMTPDLIDSSLSCQIDLPAAWRMQRLHTMKFGSTAKVLAECKLKYYSISECLQDLDAHRQMT